ncbi:MAG TPA: helix-turn-helix transcriptional regulator [Thermomicrobiales bacterium]|nr:helix-turn-helix transcriptional regulator [Thermomicrobiales bacterium]
MAKTLRAWRTERLLSTRGLADLAGSSTKTIVPLENGRQTATFATIGKLSRVLAVAPRDVVEFAQALDVRAGIASQPTPDAAPAQRRRTHVYCVSSSRALQPLADLLLQTERYGVTSVIRVPVTPSQIACARPDVIVVELDAGSPLDLLRGLRDQADTDSIPLIVTSTDRRALEQSGIPRLTIVPLDHDARELMLAVESRAIPILEDRDSHG